MLTLSCDLLTTTPAATAASATAAIATTPAASATGSLLEALAFRGAALPILSLPVHLAGARTPALRRLARLLRTLCALLGGGLIGTGVLVALLLFLRVLRTRRTIYRVPTAVVV